ncbi:MAG: exodeoxyribonuclease VII small subunit [Verrucomicrobiia bacterium]
MKPKKKSAAPVLDRNALTFEQAIDRLEIIVADMEAAELPLEDVLKKYEEGTRLVRFCNQKLEEAEKKIEVLTKKTDGSVALEPFETEPDGSEDDKPDDEGGKLF